MATSGALMMGVKAVPPMPPRLEIVKLPPCISVGLEFSGTRFLRQRSQRPRDLEDTQPIGIGDHRNHQAIRRVGGEANIEVLLEDQIFAASIQRGIEAQEIRAAPRCRL